MNTDCFLVTWFAQHISHFTFSDLVEIRTRLKDAIIGRCKNFMSTDWLPPSTARSIPVQTAYVEPCWTRTVKGTLQDEQVPMDKLYDIFDIYKNKKTKVLLSGK